MKQYYFLLISFLVLTAVCFAQAPQTINYQGVARNAAGQPYANTNIGLRLSIRSGAPNGVAAYTETRTVTTNAHGLFNVVINSPGAVSQTGSFAAINWSQGTKYMQTEIDPAGGTNFTSIGNTQMQSVPFALQSARAATLEFPRADYFNNNSTVVWYMENTGTTAPLHVKNTGSGAALIGSAATGTAVTATTNTNLSSRGAVDATNSGTAGFALRGTASNANSIGVEAINGAGLALNVNGRLKIAGGNTSPGTGKVLTSDASGNASWQTPNWPVINKVGFAVKSIAQGGLHVLPNNQWYKYHGSFEEYDPGNDYTLYNQGTASLPASSFTIPVTGFYHFETQLVIGAPGFDNNIDDGSIRIVLKRNGTLSNLVSEYSYPRIAGLTVRSITLKASTNSLLQAGDQVWVEVKVKTTDDTNPVYESYNGPEINKAYHSFSGFLIFN